MTLFEILKDAKHGLCIRRQCWGHGVYVAVSRSLWQKGLVLECGDVNSDDYNERWSPLVEEVLADDWTVYA